jgi:hypothetical protein
MFESEIELKLHLLLESITSGKGTISDSLIDEFGESCKSIIKGQLLEQRDRTEFRLRMSNIGKDLRDLHLEKEFGSVPLTSQQKVKMIYGYLVEALFVMLIKASGCKVDAEQKEVALQIKDDVIQGTYDIKIDGKIYDIKSASDYAFKHKFKTFDTVASEDAFGYVGQGIGYALADKCDFGGWIVINKTNGEFKVVKAPEDKVKIVTVTKSILEDFAKKIHHFKTNQPMPECTGVVEEEFYGKKTGNKILTKKCEWCPHKNKCHTGIQHIPDVNSKAKSPTMKYYVKLAEKKTSNS